MGRSKHTDPTTHSRRDTKLAKCMHVEMADLRLSWSMIERRKEGNTLDVWTTRWRLAKANKGTMEINEVEQQESTVR